MSLSLFTPDTKHEPSSSLDALSGGCVLLASSGDRRGNQTTNRQTESRSCTSTLMLVSDLTVTIRDHSVTQFFCKNNKLLDHFLD